MTMIRETTGCPFKTSLLVVCHLLHSSQNWRLYHEEINWLNGRNSQAEPLIKCLSMQESCTPFPPPCRFCIPVCCFVVLVLLVLKAIRFLLCSRLSERKLLVLVHLIRREPKAMKALRSQCHATQDTNCSRSAL